MGSGRVRPEGLEGWWRVEWRVRFSFGGRTGWWDVVGKVGWTWMNMASICIYIYIWLYMQLSSEELYEMRYFRAMIDICLQVTCHHSFYKHIWYWFARFCMVGGVGGFYEMTYCTWSYIARPGDQTSSVAATDSGAGKWTCGDWMWLELLQLCCIELDSNGFYCFHMFSHGISWHLLTSSVYMEIKMSLIYIHIYIGSYIVG